MLNRPRLLVLTLALATFAPSGLAQEAQEETPSLTTEDVRGPEPIVTPTEGGPVAIATGAPMPTIEHAWDEIYRALAKEGMPAADVEQLRSLIDGGGELSLAVHFDVNAAGRIENFSVRRSTGIEWIDRRVEAEAPTNSLGPDVANYRDVDVDLGVSRGRVRMSASLTAPTVAKAEAVEQFMHMLSASGGPNAPGVPGITISRSGASLSVSLDMSFEDLMRRR
jgi:hypothetical protein